MATFVTISRPDFKLIKEGSWMFAKLNNHPTAKFWLTTLLYFVVLMLVIYLYGYFGAGQAPFIYNEF